MYDHKTIDKKWQKIWKENKIYKTSNSQDKPKYYVLDMFPYPSGAGLHVGHPKGYIATDVFARFKMMNGFNVLHPMGWDAFGLPAENYAIKNKVHPKVATEQNVKRFKKQLEILGFTYDWDREINTTDPNYYKWTQWIFLQMFKRGLAYQSYEPINWCPSCKTGLANEDLEDGKCERCGSEIEQKPMRQWVLKITDYAEQLLDGLKDLDWEDSIIEMQKNWIGRSEGCRVRFKVVGGKDIGGAKNIITQTNADWTQTDAEKMQIDTDNLLYKDLTYKIRGAIFNVKKQLGLGHKENVYHKALIKEFTKIGLNFESEKRVFIYYDKEKVGVYQPDFLIDDKVIIELKALPQIGKQQLTQVWTYLKGSEYKLALLVNFGSSELYIKRIVYDKARSSFLRKSASSPHDSATFLEIFTTRPDTLFGCTYMVVCPEHELIKNLESGILNLEEVKDYIEQSKKKNNLERTDLAEEKTGVEIKGIKAINPVNGEEIPIFVADYVLAGYGTGAIMAVPAHDERDFEFAKKYGLPIKQVVKKDAQKNCLIAHGSPRTDKTKNQDYIPDNIKHWRGWLKQELENNNYKVFNPEMPIPWEPDYNEWKKQIEKLDIDENSILVGHSSGGAFLVRWLGETKQKIDKLILVAPGKEITKGGVKLSDFYNFEIDPEIKNRVNKIIIFISDDDKEHRIRNAKLYQKELNGTLFVLKNRGHFTTGDNPINNKFSELLNQILEEECFACEGININSEFPTQILDNTKTPENSEAFDRDYFYPRCESGTCHSVNIISYINKNVKSNGIEPAEGLEPSDKEMTSSCPHHAAGISMPSSLYQKNKNTTKSLNGLPTKEAKNKMIEWLEENGIGKREINYKLRDWVFSRQRYWGEPIPLIHCENCKNKKYNYIIIHGYGGSPEVNFFPWLKEELEKLGHTAVCPELPDTDEPNIDEQADYIINNFEINNNTVLVGHSLGGVVAMRLLEKTNKKVSKVLFVDSFIEPNFDDVDREQVEKSSDWNFDFEKIRSLAGEFVVLADKSYAVIPRDQPQKMAELFDATVILTDPKEWHFCNTQEPEVLKLSLEQGVYPVLERDLPLELPEVENYEPSGTGESPLANITEWVNTTCPKCGGPAKRETNTMPQWAGSCWYYLRYIDPKNNEKLVDPKKEKYWQPVDLYVGGAEHATRHLIYSRFWHHFLFDIGVVSTPEPFTKLQHVGLIMAEDGRKMSKRWNNVINPDDVIEKYGADVMRVYEMFMGPFDNAIAWSTEGLIGARRFLERVWKLKNKINPPFAKGGWGDFETSPLTSGAVGVKKLESLLHKTIKKVTDDIQNFKFNTAISSMMILLNSLEREEKIDLKYYLTLLQLLSPFAPHIAEELWGQLENKESIFSQSWTTYDESLIKNEEIELVIQINGKVRDKILASADITEEEAKEIALDSEKIQQWLGGKQPKKIIFVKGRLVSIVV